MNDEFNHRLWRIRVKGDLLGVGVWRGGATGLPDEQVRFLKGWFKDTLPTAPIQRLAVLRLDGDMHESTIVTLRSPYSELSVGGYIMIHDYAPDPPGCMKAVDDFGPKIACLRK